MSVVDGCLGFVGIGAMGDPMSARVAAAGHDVLVFDADLATTRTRIASDTRRLGTLPEIARTRLVLLMLPNSDAVESVLVHQGLLSALAPGSTVIDMSSSDARRTVHMAETAREEGIRFADAPVSGGVARAKIGDLTAMVGANEELADEISPVLSTMAARVFHVGSPGAGHAAKALNNLLSAAGLMISVEAIEAARRFGIDPRVMLDTLNVSTGMNHATQTKIERYILSRTFDSGFRAELMMKDLHLAGELIAEARLGTSLAENVIAQWRDALADLPPAADQTEIALVTEDAAKGRRPPSAAGSETPTHPSPGQKGESV